jgi:hypothetical protein
MRRASLMIFFHRALPSVSRSFESPNKAVAGPARFVVSDKENPRGPRFIVGKPSHLRRQVSKYALSLIHPGGFISSLTGRTFARQQVLSMPFLRLPVANWHIVLGYSSDDLPTQVKEFADRSGYEFG